MVRVLLMLFGADMMRRQWRLLGGLGVAWAVLGIALCVDALNGVMWMDPHYFGVFMLLEGAVTAVAGLGSAGAARRVRLAYGAMLLGLGLLVIDAPWHDDLIVALVAGFSLLADGTWRLVSAHVVRFPGWRGAMVNAGFELLLAVFALEPWPTWYKGEVGTLAGILFTVSGVNLVRIALQLRRLPPGTPIGAVLDAPSTRRPWPVTLIAAASADWPGAASRLTVHVWTPDAARAPVYRSVSRYIAVRDEEGVISTGHAALELAPDLYISHYPAQEIDRSAGDFTRALRATADNDVQGVFQPSYGEEAAGWRDATFHVRLPVYDAGRLRAFWAWYRQDSTYNLTNRNCSSAVALALEVALEGVLDRQPGAVPPLFRLLLSPELWMAGLIRQRALTMAWTPGLVLDYARALSGTLSPPPLPWYRRLRIVKTRLAGSRMERRAAA